MPLNDLPAFSKPASPNAPSGPYADTSGQSSSFALFRPPYAGKCRATHIYRRQRRRRLRHRSLSPMLIASDNPLQRRRPSIRQNRATLRALFQPKLETSAVATAVMWLLSSARVKSLSRSARLNGEAGRLYALRPSTEQEPGPATISATNPPTIAMFFQKCDNWLASPKLRWAMSAATKT